MERVASKHLFNNQLLGVVDKEVEKDRVETMEKFMQYLSEQGKDLSAFDADKLTCQEMADNMRSMVDHFLIPVGKRPTLTNAIARCKHTKFNVPPRDGNDYSVPVLVHTPEGLESKKDKPAIVYAHGGGTIVGTAEFFQPWVARAADYFGTVFFSVDYRLAPETKSPKNALDFYCALKHIIEHAAELGVDPKRIAIAGESGGGHIVMATMVMLAQRDEGHLVKLAIAAEAMIDDYHFGDPKSMTKEEKEDYKGLRKMWECLATDLDEQRKNSDPLLFPAKADDELLAKMPPTIIWEVEFDVYITETTRMARRLRSAGRLLELYIAPGVTHGAVLNPDLQVTKRILDDYKLALETYLF